MRTETRDAFHPQVSDLEGDVAQIAARVCEGIARATEAMLDDNLALAASVRADDALVDAACRQTEERVYSIIACQHPSATDLRTLLTVVRLLHELARTGDLARNIADAVARVTAYSLPPRVRGLIDQMGAEAHRLCRMALDAWTNRDAEAAAALPDLDEPLDDLNRRFLAELFAGVVPLRTTVELTLVARYYERIGDHAVAIGDQVRYVLTGDN